MTRRVINNYCRSDRTTLPVELFSKGMMNDFTPSATGLLKYSKFQFRPFYMKSAIYPSELELLSFLLLIDFPPSSFNIYTKFQYITYIASTTTRST